MNFTQEQLEAIETKTTNIIVSAGAGSGKTAVLTKRIEQLVLNNIKIDELLVLTFTKKAANEMKERIKKAIEKHQFLIDQYNKIENSYITTFDSFTSSILKKYHYELNIDKDFTIPVDGIIEIKLNEILNEIFEQYYDKEDEHFQKLIYKYALKNDKSLKSNIIKIYNKLLSLPNFYEYIFNYEKKYYSKQAVSEAIVLFESCLNSEISKINPYLEIIQNDELYYKKIKSELDELLLSKTYDEIKSSLKIKLSMVPKNSDEQLVEAKGIISKKIKELQKLCVYENKELIFDFVEETKNDVLILLEIIKKLHKEINEYKKLENYLTFDDITKKSIELLEKNETIRLELKSNFKEILIDEYQDTNDVGEKLINLISNNNVYVVGDVKQSIYKFRNANPSLFQQKYDDYKNTNAGIKIDLNNNFRSRKQVVDTINLVFSYIMDDIIGGANYRLDHNMNAGNMSYLETKDNYDLEIYNYSKEDYENYNKEEKEIFIIANDIKNKVRDKYKITKSNSLTDINYEDFCIILEKSSSFDTYKKIFEFLSIPLTIIKDSNIANENLMLIIKNYVNLIIKIKNNEIDESFKHSFISLERSFLYNELDENIYQIFIDNSFKNSKLYNTIKNILDNKLNSINQLIVSFIDKFNLYEKMVYNANIKNNDMILEFLYNTSLEFDNSSKTIEEYYEYLIKIKEYDIKINSTSTISSSNAVTIMTIHKSKGLEFPVCYIAGTTGKFNISELSDKFLISKKYGIVAPFYNGEFYPNFFKKIIEEEEIKEIVSEKIRLFYVAMTRAKEKNIIVTTLDNDKDYDIKSKVVRIEDKVKYRSFNDILKSIYPIIQTNLKKVDLDKIGLTKDYKKIIEVRDNYDLKSNVEKVQVKDLKLETNLIDNKKVIFNVNKFLSDKENQNIKIGIEFHKILEEYEFHKITKDENEFIQKIKETPFMKNIENKKIIREFEYSFNDKIGIIDMILISDELIEVIDYKLTDINKNEYEEQIKSYTNYIKSLYKDKKVEAYLYSITTGKYRKIML